MITDLGKNWHWHKISHKELNQGLSSRMLYEFRFLKKTSIFADHILKNLSCFFYGWLFINISVWGIRVYSETSQTHTVLILELFLKSSSRSFCQIYRAKQNIVKKNCRNFDYIRLQFKVVWSSQWRVDPWNGCIEFFRNRKWELSPEKVRVSDRTKCLTAPVEAVCRTALLLRWPTWNSLEVIHYHRLVFICCIVLWFLIL